jgi:pyruvate/2-oxoglutarate dehydrogenase complex dihydrolipoamide acyltransferase (E2) component
VQVEDGGRAVVHGGNGEHRERVLATPVTRRMAREMGVDLAALQGSGPLGRVMKSDVLAYVEQQKQPAVAEAEAPQARAPSPRPAPMLGGEQRIPLRGLRKRIAESMVRSKFTAPHFTFVEECDTKSLTCSAPGSTSASPPAATRSQLLAVHRQGASWPPSIGTRTQLQHGRGEAVSSS